MSEWIAVEDKLPPSGELVLVWQHMTGRCLREVTDYGTHIEWHDENNQLDDSELDITYWQFLPAPPQGDK